jgi:hypothetical protein
VPLEIPRYLVSPAMSKDDLDATRECARPSLAKEELMP